MWLHICICHWLNYMLNDMSQYQHYVEFHGIDFHLKLTYTCTWALVEVNIYLSFLGTWSNIYIDFKHFPVLNIHLKFTWSWHLFQSHLKTFTWAFLEFQICSVQLLLELYFGSPFAILLNAHTVFLYWETYYMIFIECLRLIVIAEHHHCSFKM